MTVDWLPGFEIIAGEGSGTWLGIHDAPKIVLHTTEGDTIDGAVAAFRAHRSWPHMTVDPRRRRKVQHVRLNEAARALRNTATPGQTNRDGRTYQIEIVGHAATIDQMSNDDLAWLGGQVVAPLAKATGTPLTTSVQFYGADCGWTLAVETARQRLSPGEFDVYRGILGHQHVPENTHWDPGHINIGRILAGAAETTVTMPAKWVAPKYPGTPIRPWDRGPQVRTWKLLLQGAGFGLLVDPANDRYGLPSQTATRKLQYAYYKSIGDTTSKPDGVVGPKTWQFVCARVAARKAAGKA